MPLEITMCFDPAQNFDGAEFALLCSTGIMEQNFKKGLFRKSLNDTCRII